MQSLAARDTFVFCQICWSEWNAKLMLRQTFDIKKIKHLMCLKVTLCMFVLKCSSKILVSRVNIVFRYQKP